MIELENILVNRTKTHLFIVDGKNKLDLRKYLVFTWLRKHRLDAKLVSGDKITLPGGGSVHFRAKGDKMYGIRPDYSYEVE